MIGGLLVATVSTLLIVPIVYSLLRKEAPVDYDKKIDEETHEGEEDEKNGEKSGKKKDKKERGAEDKDHTGNGPQAA